MLDLAISTTLLLCGFLFFLQRLFDLLVVFRFSCTLVCLFPHCQLLISFPYIPFHCPSTYFFYFTIPCSPLLLSSFFFASDSFLITSHFLSISFVDLFLIFSSSSFLSSLLFPFIYVMGGVGPCMLPVLYQRIRHITVISCCFA